MHSARSMHLHYVPHHLMTYNIELFSLKSISVPNLVSIAQVFLKPADPCQINSSGPGTRRLCPTETVTTETHRLWQHTCDLHVWHQRCPPFGLEGKEKAIGENNLHVHCTRTMHHSPLFHTAQSRHCQGAPKCQIWCR